MPAAEVVTTPARNSRSTNKTNPNSITNNSKSEERGMCTRSKEAMRTKDQSPRKSPSEPPSRISLRHRRDTDFKKVSSNQVTTRSSSVEIVKIKMENNSVHDAIESVIAKSVEEKESKERVSRRTAFAKKSPKVLEESTVASQINLRGSTRSSSRIDSVLRQRRKLEEEWESILKALEEPTKPKLKRKRSCKSLEPPKTEMEISKKDIKVPKESPKKSTPKNSPKALSDKTSVKNSPSENSETKELLSPKSRKILRKCSSQSNINQNPSGDNEQKSNFNSKKLTKIKKSDSSESVSLELSNSSQKPSKIVKKNASLDDSVEKPKLDKTCNTPLKKNPKLSSIPQKSQKLKNNSKVVVIEDSLSDSSEDKNDKASKKQSITQVPSKSKSSKQQTVIELSSDSSIESDEPLQVLKDRKALVKRKTRSMRSNELSSLKEKTKKIDCSSEKSNVKTPVVRTKSSEDLSEKINVVSKPSFGTPKKVMNSLETIKLEPDVNTLKKTPEVLKPLVGSKRRKATVKSEKFIKKEKLDFTEFTVSTNVVPNTSVCSIPSMGNSKFVPTTNNSAITSTSPSKTALKNVDVLVAAVSSLVELETKSLKENEEKTLAAHSLLELGNSPLFAKVGSMPTSNPEVIDLTLPSSNSPSLFKENFSEPDLELSSGECNIKSLLINQPLPFCNSTSYKPLVNSPLVYSKNSERFEKQVAINTPYMYRNPEKPVAFNPSYMLGNSENYEKPIAVNTPFIFRNSDKYERQIAVNTPYIHRNSEKYEKHVAINTPYIHRNLDRYEKQVAVNTPYLYRNGESQEKTAASSLLMRNLPKRRNTKDKKLIKGEIHSQIDKPPSVIIDNDLNNNMNKSNQVGPSSASNASSSLNGNNLRANHFSKSPNGVCIKPSSKHEVKSLDTKNSNMKTSLPRNHSFPNHEHPIIPLKSSRVHSESSDSGKALNLCNKPEKRAALDERKIMEERLPKPALDEKPLLFKPMNVIKRSKGSIPSANHSDEQPMNLSRAGSLRKVTPHIKRCAPRLRSESEDSDGKLVIDLDRRSSVDERAPMSPVQSPVPAIDASPSEPPRLPFRSAEENEAGRTLLELTRSMVSPDPGAVGRAGDEGVSSAELEEKREGDESILRTLLLESGAIGHRTPQDRSQNGSDSSNISSNSKNPLTRFLMMCKKTGDEDSSSFSSSESASIDGKTFSLEILSSLNENSLIADLEANHHDIKEQIRKLKSEIVYLKCVADKKDRERTAVVCFKRSSSEVIEESVQIICQTTSSSRKTSSDSHPPYKSRLSSPRNSSRKVTNSYLNQRTCSSELGSSENSALSVRRSHHAPLLFDSKTRPIRKVLSSSSDSINIHPHHSISSDSSTDTPLSSQNDDRNTHVASSTHQSSDPEGIHTTGSTFSNSISNSRFMSKSQSDLFHLKGRRSKRKVGPFLEDEEPNFPSDPRVIGPTLIMSSEAGGPPNCMGCGIKDGVLLCSGCRKHWYCSPKCQNRRWPEHKSECCNTSRSNFDSGPSISFK